MSFPTFIHRRFASRGGNLRLDQAGSLKLSPRLSTAQHLRAFLAAIATMAFQFFAEEPLSSVQDSDEEIGACARGAAP